MGQMKLYWAFRQILVSTLIMSSAFSPAFASGSGENCIQQVAAKEALLELFFEETPIEIAGIHLIPDEALENPKTNDDVTWSLARLIELAGYGANRRAFRDAEKKGEFTIGIPLGENLTL